MPEPPELASNPDACSPSRRAVAVFFIVAAVLLVTDLLSKTIAFERVAGQPITLAAGDVNEIPPHDAVIVVPRVLAFKLTLNRGAAFGLAQGGRWIFIGVAIGAVAVIATFFWKSRREERWLRAALALMLAGALGNLYDRIRFGMVRDFMWLFPDVKLPFGWTWPGSGSRELYPWIFNVADAAMCVAVVLVTVHVIGGRNVETSKRRNVERG